MDNLRRLPKRQAVLVDERGVSLRLTWHAERDQVVLSIWHDGTCAASFRLPVEEAPQVAGFLMAALGDWASGVARPAGGEAGRALALSGALTWAQRRLARLRRHLRRSA
jgi:hypothetical protein